MAIKTAKIGGIDTGKMPIIIGVGIGVIVLGIFIGLIVASGGNDNTQPCIYGENSKKEGYCNLSDEQYGGLAIVTGNTQNFPEPELGEYNKVADALNDAFYGENFSIDVVSAARGNYDIRLFKDEKEKGRFGPAGNINASLNNFKKFKTKIEDAIKSEPTANGVDYLGGIMQAKRKLDPSIKNPVIIVIGSGYSDSGALNFANDEILENYIGNRDWAHDELISKMSENSQYERDALSGVTIIWRGIGVVAKPQINMNKYILDTEKIYKIVLEEFLGAKVDFDPTYKDYPDAKSVQTNYSVQPTFVDELEPGIIFDINDNIGRFEADSDVLKNPEEVTGKMKQFAKRFNPNSGVKLAITGYIAYCIDNGELGLSRANVIKNLLVGLGVPEAKIETYGEGGSIPADGESGHICIDDRNEEEARLRRTVRIRVVKE